MQAAPIVFKKVWMGRHIKKAHSIVILGAVGIICLDLIVETALLPLLYRGIPVPFKESGKPIGAVLLPATFFNVLLIATNILVFAYLLHKAGFNLGLVPKTRDDWLDVLAFFIFLISGMAMWYAPILLLTFLISGVLLVAGQLS